MNPAGQDDETMTTYFIQGDQAVRPRTLSGSGARHDPTRRTRSGRSPSWSGPGKALRQQWADDARAAQPCPAGCGHTRGMHLRRGVFEQVGDQKRCVTCGAVYGRTAFAEAPDQDAYSEALETCIGEHRPDGVECKHPGCTCTTT